MLGNVAAAREVRWEDEWPSQPEGDSEGDSEGGDFCPDQADHMEVFRDWASSLDKWNGKMLSTYLCFLMQRLCPQKKVSAIYATIADLLSSSERTVRAWKHQFVTNGGTFPEAAETRGRKHAAFRDDEELCRRARQWVREHSHVKGQPNMRIPDFCNWVNSDLLPSVHLVPGFPRQISQSTARTWLEELGFQFLDYSKGTYVDGHERDDVVAYRKDYLAELRQLEAMYPPPPDPSDVPCPPPPPGQKRLVIIDHDESTFYANDDESRAWGEPGSHYIKPKGKGSSIMVSDFIDELNGPLCLSDAEFALHQKSKPGLRQEARVLLECGENRDGYWDSKKFLLNVQAAADIADIKYPAEKYDILWLFDNAPSHRKMADDALNVHNMNMKPGGQKPILRDTQYKDASGAVHQQQMHILDQNGKKIPKGTKRVLEERGISTAGMDAKRQAEVLAAQPDFQSEISLVEQLLTRRGHRVKFTPKFHCELQPIELYWAHAKRKTRASCNYSIVSLRKCVRPALDSVPLSTIRKCYQKMRDYMRAYLDGKSAGIEVESAVKIYKSHRRPVKSDSLMPAPSTSASQQ